jgi:hypothetical protein
MTSGRVQETPTNRSADALAGLQQMVAAVLGPRPPEPGERAKGLGMSGAVVAVPERQPLAADNVWRVTLAGEPFGRLVGRARDGAWQLLQLDDLTDAQLDAFEVAIVEPSPWREMLTSA